jgi:hypothetical protein
MKEWFEQIQMESYQPTERLKDKKKSLPNFLSFVLFLNYFAIENEYNDNTLHKIIKLRSEV